MHENNFNSDSDDEDDHIDENHHNSNPNNSTWNIRDIEKLKEQTNELLDASWKETRNKHLLYKMLDLEQPIITAKMVDFLLQDSVCETLISFITLNSSAAVRPSPSDSNLLALKKSYRAVIVLSPDVPSEPLNSLLNKKAFIISRKIFDMFNQDSAGSFYHAYRLLESLLRYYPTDVYNSLTNDGLVSIRMKNMLRYIGFPPVAELYSMIISLTPLPRTNPLYSASHKARWQYLQEMINWGFILQLCKVICNPEEICNLDAFVTADQHSSAAAQLLQELIEKITLEESGEVLLQVIGDNPLIINTLIDGIVKSELSNENPYVDGYRRHAAKVLCFLLRRAADIEVLCYTHHNNNAPPTPSYVPNKLFVLRESIVNYTRSRLPELISFLLVFDSLSNNHNNKEPMKYSYYEISRPFTAVRAQVIELLVLMIESDDSIAVTIISIDCWVLLITWVLKYSHNNIFHALFYRLIFAVLRQQQEHAQKILFQKAKFISFLIENFTTSDKLIDKYSLSKIISPVEKDLLTKRVTCRGLIMNCSNAIRLQLNYQSKDTYLNKFLHTHPKWNEFVTLLKDATELQLQYGLGIGLGEDGDLDSRATLSANERGGGPVDISAKINEWTEGPVRYARILGFYDENNTDVSNNHSLLSSPNNSSHSTISLLNNNTSITNTNEIHDRRLSFEEGYGSFSAFIDKEYTSTPYIVDEIDQVQQPSNKTFLNTIFNHTNDKKKSNL